VSERLGTPTFGIGQQTSAVATVLVIDEQLLVSSALAHTLRGQRFDAYSLRITDLAGVLSAALAHRPGLVLLDLDLRSAPDGQPINGIDLIGPLRAQGWTVLVITGTVSRDRIADAIARGAANWIVKGATFAELVHAANEILQGRGQLAPADRAALIDRHFTVQLTQRENDTRLGRGLHIVTEGQPLQARSLHT
jgi:DNA-binding NarL/FixJ family response regulator